MSDRPPYSAEVLRAAGMVSVQADCRVEEALALMRDRAEVAGVTIDVIAAAVLDHSIDFIDFCS